MEKQLVVARFKENVNWLIESGLADNALIYNKGPVDFSTELKYVCLPNVGREAHTYLTHIITNYDKLADITYFTQGNPFDHSPDFIEKVKAPPPKTFKHLGIHLHRIYKRYLDDRTMYDRHLLGVATGLSLLETLPEEFNFAAGAIIAVPKPVILSRSKEFYEQALSFFYEWNERDDPGHAFERLWEFIFAGK
jgi:hypothetical protein